MPTASSVLPALLLVGLATTVWVFAPAFHGPAAARRDLGSHRLAIGSVVAVLLLNAMLTLPLAPVLRPTPTTGFTTGTFLIAALATQVPMLVVVYGRLIAPGAVTPRELGLRAMPLGTIVRVGVGAGVIGLILTIVVDVALSQLGLRPNQLDQFRFVRREGLTSFVLVLASGAVVAPIVEELFFRGFLFGFYRRRQPLWVAYLVSGLIFALLHLEPVRMSPSQMAGLAVGIFVLGTLLALVYQLTDSLYPGMLAHALNNATGLVLYYSVGTSG